MAWQLIYTSAPRLLEAGRSGFGTVARHRDIPPLVVAAVERISQFSRQPGLDPARVIYAHRMMSISGQRYHVLSSIRDAGADYTGRTNHIAHHLIAEPQEVAALAISSADVLVQMPWTATWTDQPRWLEDHETIPLASFPSCVGSNGAHWSAITGNPQHAQLLANGDAAHGCYLIAPQNTDLRPLLAESLSQASERRWQVAFTTSLQPSDEPTDFRWLGLEANSPLRGACETSGRMVLDLSRPQTLPSPPAPAPAAARIERASSAPQFSAESVSPSPARQPSTTASAPIFAEDRWAKRKQQPVESTQTRYTAKKPARWIWIAAAIAVFVVGAGVGGAVLYRRTTLKGERTSLIAQLPDFVRNTPKGQDALGGILWSTHQKAKDLAVAASEVARVVETGKLDELQTEQLRVAANAAEAAGMNVGAYREILNVATEVTTRRDEARKPKPIGEALQADGVLLQKLTATLHERAAFQAAQDELRHLWLIREADALAEALENNTEQKLTLQQFQGALAELEQKNKKEFSLPQLENTQAIVADWKELAGNRRIPEKPTWPKWLRDYSRPKVALAETAKPETAEKRPTNAEAPTKPKTPSYFAVGFEDLALVRINELPAECEYYLVEGGGPSAKLLTPPNLRRKVSDTTRVFVVDPDAQTISLGDSPPILPCKLIVKAPDGRELCSLTIVSQDQKSPLAIDHNLTIKRTGDRIEVVGALPVLDKLGAIQLRLSLPLSLTTPNGSKIFDLDTHKTTSIATQIKELEQRIAGLEKDAADFHAQAQQADTQTNFATITEKANRSIGVLTGERESGWKKGERKNSQQVVGDFAKALADEWKSKKEKEKRFDMLRTRGHTLGEKMKSEDALAANQELLEEVKSLLNLVKDDDKPVQLRHLESLANDLKKDLDPTEREGQKKNLLAHAGKKMDDAAILKADPLLNPKMAPFGEYRLLARGPSEREALIAIIKIEKP